MVILFFLLLSLLPHVGSPVVLDLVVGAAGYFASNSRPSVSPFGVEVKNKALFVGGHLAPFEAGVKIVNPTKPATFACSFQT